MGNKNKGRGGMAGQRREVEGEREERRMSSVFGTLLVTGVILCLSFTIVLQNSPDMPSISYDSAFREFTHGAEKIVGDRPGFYQQRDLLRLFPDRGTQGMPFIPTAGPTGGPATTTPTVLEYFTPMIIVAGIGIGIGIVSCLFACVLWFCRCCCKRCCKGQSDPERSYLIIRLMIIALGFFVLAGAFIGLFGGRSVSFALRDGIDVIIAAIEKYGSALVTLERVASAAGLPPNDLTAIRQAIQDFGNLILLARQYFSPVDAVRLGILYSSMSVGMLAAIGLGLGACLKRKEILGVSFVSATLAILIAWFTFGVNYPLAVTLDDTCETVRQVVGQAVIVNGVEFIVGCLPESLFTSLNEAARSSAYQLADLLESGENQANSMGNGTVFFDPITVSRTALNATFPNFTAFSVLLETQYNNTDTTWRASPCLTSCTDGINLFGETFDQRLISFFNVSDASKALVVLQNCTDIELLITNIRDSLCTELTTAILLTFVGAIVIGSLLIPMALMGVYVAQKFPNRGPAARVKSRILVIFCFLFFHCLVAVLAEVNTWWLEYLVVIGTIVGGALGLLLMLIPMNKWDWEIKSQVTLALLLCLYMCALLAGWIYLFYNAVLNNIACGQDTFSFTQSIVTPFDPLIPVCSQQEYAHSLILAIFAGTATAMSGLSALLCLVLAYKIGCGTPLNLESSDYELD